MNYDVIVIGAGPAGLSAGTELAKAGRRVLLLDKESFGGPVINVEWINGYPGPKDRTAGAMVATELVNRATEAGVEMELGEVAEIESYSDCKSVTCSDGKGYTAVAVIVAGGLDPKKLGVPGEDRFAGKGMIHCAMCDAGLYRERAVAVCGGGGAGLTEALYLARFAARVHVIESQPELSARKGVQERARSESKLAIRCGERVIEVLGTEGTTGGVTGIRVRNAATGEVSVLEVHGVLVRVGFSPSTRYLEGVLELDAQQHVAVGEGMRTDVAGIYAAGDIRSGSPRSVAQAIADGRAAGLSALRFLDSGS